MSPNMLMVVESQLIKQSSQKTLGPRWRVCVEGEGLTGSKFDLIVIAAALTSNSEAMTNKNKAWFDQLKTHLAVGGRISEVV